MTDNKDNDNVQPIHEAAQNGDIETMAALLEAGADIETPDSVGSTPLVFAVLGKKPAALRFLIERGAKVNAWFARGISALQALAMDGEVEMMALLLDKGADIENQCDEGETPLFGAVVYKRIEAVKLLLERGANVQHARHKDGWTPLHSAAFSGNVEMMTLLLDAGSNIESRSNNGETPLHYAILSKNPEAVRFLLKRGANPHARNNNGRTSMHMTVLLSRVGEEAVTKVMIEMMKILIDKGADVNVRYLDEATPLHLAATTGNIEIMTVLLDNGAEIEAQNMKFTTPLCRAVMRGKSEAVKFLIGKRADVNRTCVDDISPLHLAVADNSVDIVAILLEAGADTEARDRSDKTPLDYAIEKNHTEVIELLRKANDNVDDAVRQMASIRALSPSGTRFITGGLSSNPLIRCSEESGQWLCILGEFVRQSPEKVQRLGSDIWERPVKSYIKRAGDYTEDKAAGCCRLLRNLTRYLCYSRFAGLTTNKILDEMARATHLIESGDEYEPDIIVTEQVLQNLHKPIRNGFTAFSAIAILEHIRQCELIEDGEIDDFVDFDPCAFGYILPRTYLEDVQSDEEKRQLWQCTGWTAQDAPLLHSLGNLYLECGFMKKFDDLFLQQNDPYTYFERKKERFKTSKQHFTCRDIGNSDFDLWTPEECRKRCTESAERLARFLGKNLPVSRFRATEPPVEQKKLDPGIDRESASWKDAIFIQAGLKGIDIYDKDGASPLHWTAWHGDTGILTALLEKGADPKVRDSKGKTPLDYAFEKNNAEVIELLQKSSTQTIFTKRESDATT